MGEEQLPLFIYSFIS